MNQRWLDLPRHYDFAGTLGALTMGRHDPCMRLTGTTFSWATRTPDGPATLCLQTHARTHDSLPPSDTAPSDTAPSGTAATVRGLADAPPHRLLATAYGPGATWALAQADALAGLRDDLTGFADIAQRHHVVARLTHQMPGLRMGSTGRVFPRLLRAILEQKVTVKEAHHAYVATVRHFHRASGNTPAPGPATDLLLPPEPEAVAATPYWVFHPFGVEARRAETICRAAAAAPRLERCPDPATLTKLLTAIPGIGAWTAAEVIRDVFGDPDAVSVHDYHLPHTIAWALAGEARAGGRSGPSPAADARMLELLEPFTGHRGRVCALIARAGHGAPRFGPRQQIRSFARF